MGRHARGFAELEVYQKAEGVAVRIFHLTCNFPKGEAYSLTDQILRSSRSVGALIAEAWGVRRYARFFVSKLVQANAEQLETQHWLRTAATCGYLAEDEKEELTDELARIGRMLNSMIHKAHRFCGAREP